jgi:hypothetical protein
VTVAWTASGGKMAATGAFSAATAGTYRIIARHQLGHADSAQVTVTDGGTPSTPPAATPPPPPSSGGAHPNEPAGFAMITQREFDSKGENGWLDGSHSVFRLISDASSPGATPSVGEMIFSPSLEGGSGPSYASAEGFPGNRLFRKAYMSFWLKVSPNWFGHQIFCKIGYAHISGQAKFFLALNGNGTGGLTLTTHSQGMYQGGSQGGANFPNNLGSGSFSRGQWHLVEAVVWSNNRSAGSSDGGVSWWLDGQAVGSVNDVAWVGPNESDTWDTFSWRPIWGGGPSPIPADQSMYVDKFYASGG